MKAINSLLKNNNLRANKYSKIGKNYVVDTNDGKYVINPKCNNKEIFDYLLTRNYNYHPNIIDSNDKYQLVPYIDDIGIPREQKMNDLINNVSLLHSKTTYYKEIDESDYKQLYEDLTNNIAYLYEYYNDIITIIDSKVYMSPDEYLLARNISLIFKNLKYCEDEIQKWYDMIQDLKKVRVSVIHNNLSLDHFLQDNNDYLISWDKARIDIPIFDLYKLYNKHATEFDFYDILSLYEDKYPLKEEELKLFFILISMPAKIEFNKDHYKMCLLIRNELTKLIKSHDLVRKCKAISKK